MVRLSDVFGPDGNPKIPPQEGKKEVAKEKLVPREVTPPPEKPLLSLGEIGKREAATLYQEAVQWVKKKFEEAETGPLGDLAEGLELVKRMVQLVSGGGEELLSLTAGGKEESYIFPHCVNVAVFSLVVGQGLRYNQEALTQLGVAALVHDLGMAKVPKALLEKEAPLTEEEKAIVKKHPIYTVQLLEEAKQLDHVILDAISHEHERLDGSGYPSGLREEQISDFGGIIAVVDVYEALTHPRPYRKRYTPDEAMKMIAYSMGSQFKPNLVRILKALVKELSLYPVGCFVQLNTKEIGQVIKINKNFPLLPILDIYMDGSGTRLTEVKRINLAQEPLLHIKRSVDIFEVTKKI